MWVCELVSFHTGKGPVASYCEYVIELWGSIQCRKRLYCLNKYWLISRDFAHCIFLATLQLRCCGCQLISSDKKGQMNVSGQLETQKDMAAALSRKTNRRLGTISNPPEEEEEVDNSAWSHNLTNTSLVRCHHTNKCSPWKILLISAM